MYDSAMPRKLKQAQRYDARRGGSPFVLGSPNVDYRRRYINFHSNAPFKLIQHLMVDGMPVGHYVVTPGYAVWRRYGNDRWQAICSVSGAGRWGLPEEGYILGGRQLILTRPGPAWDYGIAPGADH